MGTTDGDCFSVGSTWSGIVNSVEETGKMLVDFMDSAQKLKWETTSANRGLDNEELTGERLEHGISIVEELGLPHWPQLEG